MYNSFISKGSIYRKGTDMTQRNIIDTITEAFERSTKSHNAFSEAIRGIAWEHEFEADGEMYFSHESGLLLTTPSLDPFQITREWPAEMTLADMSATIDVFGRAHDLFGAAYA